MPQSIVRPAWSFRSRLVLMLLVLFGTLVAARIHGSSIAFTARIWASQEAMDDFLAIPLLPQLDPVTAKEWRVWLRVDPRWIRIDEWAHATPAALAQFAHKPRFPVVNTNMGNGANMLLLPWAPVVHPATIARPNTWGYLVLGSQAGLAWSWWWPSFSCFLGLYLLFEILIPRRPLLGVLGGGWFCCSAYIGGWSEWAAYATSFAAFGVVCAYRLLTSSRRRVLLVAGAGLGVTFSGFAMQLYPPWQIPLAQASLLMLAGLVWRERLWQTWAQQRTWRMQGLGLAVLMSALVLGSFLFSSWGALQTMAQSVYPGQRRLLGGDFPDWRLFGGLYNYFTKNSAPTGTNESEAAGFFMLFPAVGVAALASRHIRSRLDPVAWLLLGLTALLTWFSLVRVPDWVAIVTLLSRCQGFRAQLVLGLISIVLCMQMLAAARGITRNPREARATALAVFFVCGAFFLWEGARYQSQYHYFASTHALPSPVIQVSLGAAVVCALMALGYARVSSVVLGVAVVLTSWSFNPLGRGFPKWRESELGRAMADVLQSDPRPDGRQSLWLTFGDDRLSIASAAQVMGARTLGGFYQYPQLDLWRALDPQGKEDSKYNRFAAVSLRAAPSSDTESIIFKQPWYTTLQVYVSPLHPALRKLGARYVLHIGGSGDFKSPPYILRHASGEGAFPFSIWELPPLSPKRPP